VAEGERGGNVLTRQAGPLKAWQWAAAAVGAYLIFRWYQGRQASNSAALGTTSGLPGAFSTVTSPDAGTTTNPPTSWQDWLQQALSGFSPSAGYNQAAFFNDATKWINGSCVSQQGYNALSNALATIGLPPGFGTGLPALTVCATSTPPPGGGGTTTGPTSPSNPENITDFAKLPAAWKAIINHFPAPGVTGLAWSKMTGQQQLNTIIHTPVNGLTGEQWSKLTIAQRIDQYAHQSHAKARA
jgi:hypothetical protein